MIQIIKIYPYGIREYDASGLYEKDINSEEVAKHGKDVGKTLKKNTKKKIN